MEEMTMDPRHPLKPRRWRPPARRLLHPPSRCAQVAPTPGAPLPLLRPRAAAASAAAPDSSSSSTAGSPLAASPPARRPATGAPRGPPTTTLGPVPFRCGPGQGLRSLRFHRALTSRRSWCNRLSSSLPRQSPPRNMLASGLPLLLDSIIHSPGCLPGISSPLRRPSAPWPCSNLAAH